MKQLKLDDGVVHHKTGGPLFVREMSWDELESYNSKKHPSPKDSLLTQLQNCLIDESGEPVFKSTQRKQIEKHYGGITMAYMARKINEVNNTPLMSDMVAETEEERENG